MRRPVNHLSLRAFGLLLSLGVALSGAPSAAWAMRNIQPANNAGLEQEIAQQLAPAAGLENTLVRSREFHAWDEQTSRARRQEVLALLDGRTSDEYGWNPQALSYHPVPGFSPLYRTVEKWNERLETQSTTYSARPVLVRVGSLFYLDVDSFWSSKTRLETLLGGNLIWVNNLEESSIAQIGNKYKQIYGAHGYSTGMAIISDSTFELEHVVNAGMGDGTELLAAAARGAKHLEGFDKEPARVEQAIRNLESNGYVNGVDFNLFVADLRAPDSIRSQLKPEWRGERTGLIANIGIGPAEWGVSNVEIIRLIDEVIPNVTHLLAAGYTGSSSERMPEGLSEDQALLLEISDRFSIRPEWARFHDNQYQHAAVVWTASREVGLEDSVAVESVEVKRSQPLPRLSIPVLSADQQVNPLRFMVDTSAGEARVLNLLLLAVSLRLQGAPIEAAGVATADELSAGLEQLPDPRSRDLLKAMVFTYELGIGGSYEFALEMARLRVPNLSPDRIIKQINQKTLSWFLGALERLGILDWSQQLRRQVDLFLRSA